VLITKDTIRQYASASGDDNPIHLDDSAAREAGLSGIIAHGMLSMGILGSLVSVWAGGSRYVRRMDCRFVNIVRPGDTLTFAATILEITAENVVVASVSVTNELGQPVLANTIVEFELADQESHTRYVEYARLLQCNGASQVGVPDICPGTSGLDMG